MSGGKRGNVFIQKGKEDAARHEKKKRGPFLGVEN